MSDNADRYRRAVEGFAGIVDQVPADKWSAPSPCAEWTAAHIVGHVIGGSQMVSAARTGDTPNYDALAAAGDDPAANYKAARDAALETLTDEYLGETVQGPMGPTTLDNLIGTILASDTLIHTWDLAKSIGVDVQLDPEVAEFSYNGLVQVDDVVRQAGIFGPKVEAPADADIQTKLIAFTGRQP